MSPKAPTLRPYQLAALEAVSAARAAGHNRLLVKKPTGTGKTVTFAAMPEYPGLADWLATFPAGERKMLVIAHREELLDQAAQKIQQANPHLRVQVEQADRVATRSADVVCASIQTLAASQFKRLRRLCALHTFRLVIVDEAHHAAARTYRGALAILGFLPLSDGEGGEAENVEAADFTDVQAMESALRGWDARAPQDRLLVGVTATPNRSDAVGLGCVFQTLAYSYDLKTAIDDHWLVPIVPWVIETDTSLDDVKVNRGEFNQRELADTVNTPERNALAVAAWDEYAPGRPTLAFTVDVAHAHALADAFRQRGVRATALSGDTPKDDRRLMLRQYLDGQIDVIANCMVLTEGTDLPLTSCILHAKPTKSATLYEQMTGRGLRTHPGKTDCLVLDIVDVARRHSLQTAPVLYGLPPGLKVQGQDLREAQKLVDELREQYQGFDAGTAGKVTLDELRAAAKSFDIWSIKPLDAELVAGCGMSWVSAGETYVLQFPHGERSETVAVTTNLLNQWDVTLTSRVKVDTGGQRLTWQAEPPRTIASGLLTANAAMRAGEAFVRAERRDVVKLTDTHASWKQDDATPAQLGFLRKLRVPLPAGKLTKGQAGQLITKAKAMRGMR